MRDFLHFMLVICSMFFISFKPAISFNYSVSMHQWCWYCIFVWIYFNSYSCKHKFVHNTKFVKVCRHFLKCTVHFAWLIGCNDVAETDIESWMKQLMKLFAVFLVIRYLQSTPRWRHSAHAVVWQSLVFMVYACWCIIQKVNTIRCWPALCYFSVCLWMCRLCDCSK